jgi:hypothetical protein
LGPRRERRLLVTLSLLGNVLLLAALFLGDGGGCGRSGGGAFCNGGKHMRRRGLTLPRCTWCAQLRRGWGDAQRAAARAAHGARHAEAAAGAHTRAHASERTPLLHMRRLWFPRR